MFAETVVASKFREKLAHYLEMITGNKVVQILHRGNPVKVIMTQEHYLNLLSRLSLYESVGSEAKVDSASVEDLAKTVANRVRALESEQELVDVDSHQMERKGIRIASRMGR